MLTELVIASHNKNKIYEFQNMLKPFNVTVYSASQLNLPDVEETGSTFSQNAQIKAEEIAKLTNKPCLADDSGLCVNALNGAPGVFSARYAPNRDFNLAMTKLLSELSACNTNDWSAYFACVLALKIPHQDIRFYEGRVEGTITPNRQGTNGFGFDPIFIPQGHTRTFAQMSDEEKASLSHRGKALKLFLDKEFNV
jgi:XTP/dITP diphosphohydrolase